MGNGIKKLIVILNHHSLKSKNRMFMVTVIRLYPIFLTYDIIGKIMLSKIITINISTRPMIRLWPVSSKVDFHQSGIEKGTRERVRSKVAKFGYHYKFLSSF